MRCGVLSGAVGIAAVVAGASGQGGFYPIGDLPGGTFESRAEGISPGGATILGSSSDYETWDHHGECQQYYNYTGAFTWTRATGIKAVSKLGLRSSATALTPDGLIMAGTYKGYGGILIDGFYWLPFDLLNGDAAVPTAMSHGGVVVGYAEHYEPVDECTDQLVSSAAFEWRSAVDQVQLPFPDGVQQPAFAYAHGIDSQGWVIVGESDSGKGRQAGFWGGDRTFFGLGDLPGGGFRSSARAATAMGMVIVGYGHSASGKEAFRWVKNQGMTGLGSLAPPPNFNSAAYAISADGRIVVGESHGYPFIWSPGKGMRNLVNMLAGRKASPPEGWALSRAIGISADGRAIVGNGTNPAGNPEAWVAYLESTHRATVSQAEVPANADSGGGSIATGGQLVAFSSDATNLVPGDTNAKTDIFVRNRAAGWTSRVSVGPSEAQANGSSSAARITPDGRFVVFASLASNLVPGDSNNAKDVFVRDRVAGTTSRVSLTVNGAQADGASDQPQITPDGRFIVFQSAATNLVAGDTNGKIDIFFRDRQAGHTARMSVSTAGQQGNGDSTGPSISNSGLAVVFTSAANNLTPGDTNSRRDVFLHSRYTGMTGVLTNAYTGYPGNGDSFGARIAGGGRYVALTSDAHNLIPDQTEDTNVYVWDRQTLTMALATRPVPLLHETGGPSTLSAISSDGRYVLFSSLSARFDWADTNSATDAFVRDMASAEIWRIGLGTACEQPATGAFGGSLSPDGAWATFTTDSPSMTADDTDEFNDVFVRSLFQP
jgi:Tol biopolymer transport system component